MIELRQIPRLFFDAITDNVPPAKESEAVQLRKAIAEGKEEIIETIFTKTPALKDKKLDNGLNALHTAISLGDHRMVKFLLKNGCDPTKTICGNNALSYAVYEGQDACLANMLVHLADLSSTLAMEKTLAKETSDTHLIFLAAEHRDVEQHIAALNEIPIFFNHENLPPEQYLYSLLSNSRIQAIVNQYNLSPLHIAAASGNVDAFNYLLQTFPPDMDPNVVSKLGFTPMHYLVVSCFQKNDFSPLAPFIRAGGDLLKTGTKSAPIAFCGLHIKASDPLRPDTITSNSIASNMAFAASLIYWVHRAGLTETSNSQCNAIAEACARFARDWTIAYSTLRAIFDTDFIPKLIITECALDSTVQRGTQKLPFPFIERLRVAGDMLNMWNTLNACYQNWGYRTNAAAWKLIKETTIAVTSIANSALYR